MSFYVYHDTVSVCIFLCILRILYYVLFLVHLCAFDTRLIKCNLLAWLHNCYIFYTNLAFPHGESHDGSPGFDDFQRAKSFPFRFSLRRSSDTLRSPDNCKHPADIIQYNTVQNNITTIYIILSVNCHIQIPYDRIKYNITMIKYINPVFV